MTLEPLTILWRGAVERVCVLFCRSCPRSCAARTADNSGADTGRGGTRNSRLNGKIFANGFSKLHKRHSVYLYIANDELDEICFCTEHEKRNEHV